MIQLRGTRVLMWVTVVSSELPFKWNRANLIFDCDQVCYEYVAEQGKELYELVSTQPFYVEQ